MIITEVKTKKDWKRFHQVPRRVYAGDSHWVCPLESDIESIFDPASNKTFQHGEARQFVLLEKDGRPAGRIAAFIDHDRNSRQDFPTGGIGFFECVPEEAYANALFEQAETYLKSRGVAAIDGPVNFGERERYWGLLEKGYHQRPLFQENYQPPYYKNFFLQQGYQPFEQILTFKGMIGEVPAEKFRRIAERAQARYPFHAEYFDMKRLDRMADHFCQVYNRAFAHFDHFKAIEQKQMQALFKDFTPIADWKTTAIAYHEDRPIGFCVLLPDINLYLRPAKGKLNFWTLPGFFLRFRLASGKSLKGIAFGIDPEFHRRGVFSVLINKLYSPHLTKHYETFFLAGIRGHNTIMVNSILNLGVHPECTHIAYRKVLDEKLPLKPFPFREV